MTACAKGGECNWIKTEETADDVTHECTKCGDVYTRDKQK